MKIQEHRQEAQYLAAQMKLHPHLRAAYEHETIGLMALAIEQKSEDTLAFAVERFPPTEGEEDLEGAIRYLAEAISRSIKKATARG